MNGLLRVFARSTEPSPDAVDRLRAATDRACARDPLRVTLLRRLPVPGDLALARLQALSRARSRKRPVAVGIAAAAAVAAVVVVFALAGPALLHRRLEAEVPTALPLVRGVDLVITGRGLAQGTEATPRIRWETGRIELDIDPAAHRDVTVETSEAMVHVVGTAFTLVRDAFGTTVEVTRGRVDVACRDGSGASLEATHTITCWPVRPAGLLGRAQALRSDPARSLEALDRALPWTSAGNPIRGEILALRAEDLLTLGRAEEARAAAGAYLAEGYEPRRERMETIVNVGGTP